MEDVLFLDIETIPQHRDYNDLPERSQKLWDKKASFLVKNEEDTPASIYERAGIYAEFGKIVSIAVGYFVVKDGERAIRIKDFSGHDEKEILLEFKALLERHFNGGNVRLCAHNGKEFDFPYLARRMVINGIGLPKCLQLSGKKPWEIRHLDTMELWKFGDFKHFTSLDLLSSILGIPSSKDDIDGSQVYRVYYEENDLDRVAEYCKRDVAVLAQVFLRLQTEPILPEEQIVYV